MNFSIFDDLLDIPTDLPKILLVDDQRVNLQFMAHIFAHSYQVLTAESGEQALDLCHRTPPDLILLDIGMPGMDGFEVCTQLKADAATQDIPVIFVTANRDEASETRGLELGAVDFISKPVNPAVVRARVKTHLTVKLQSDLLRRLVFRDGLTGVFNRRYFDQQLRMETARASRVNHPLALIMLDVDFFKRFNDRYGHQAGDDCLRLVAQTLKANLRRPADLVARYGGEEFVCLLPDTGFDQAMMLATELETQVRLKTIAHADSDSAKVVTVSLGVAGCNAPLPCTADKLLAAADQQLYLAKHHGRGCVRGQAFQ